MIFWLTHFKQIFPPLIIYVRLKYYLTLCFQTPSICNNDSIFSNNIFKFSVWTLKCKFSIFFLICETYLGITYFVSRILSIWERYKIYVTKIVIERRIVADNLFISFRYKTFVTVTHSRATDPVTKIHFNIIRLYFSFHFNVFSSNDINQ